MMVEDAVKEIAKSVHDLGANPPDRVDVHLGGVVE